MNLNKNSMQKLKTNIYLDDFKVDNRIIPLFKTPIILKKIQLLKKFKNNELIKIQKKLSFKIKPLNERLVRYSKIIKIYKFKINNMILKNIMIKKKNINNSKFLFLEASGGELSKLKLYLNKFLWAFGGSNDTYRNGLFQTSITAPKERAAQKESTIKKNKTYLFNLKSTQEGLKLNKFYNSLYNPPLRRSALQNKQLTQNDNLGGWDLNRGLPLLQNDLNKKNNYISLSKDINTDISTYNLNSNIQNHTITLRSEDLNNNLYYWVNKTLHKNYNFKKGLLKYKLIKNSNIDRQKDNINKNLVVRKANKEMGIFSYLSLNPFSFWLRKLSISGASRGSIKFYLPYILDKNPQNFKGKEIMFSQNKLIYNSSNDSSLHQLKLLTALRLIQASTCLSSNLFYTDSDYKENYFKKILEIRNLLVILKNIEDHINNLIDERRKLILKRKIKIVNKILAEQAIESEKENLKKRIEIFNINSSFIASSNHNLDSNIELNQKDKSDEVKYFVFPAKDSFYQKEVFKFKEDIELMLANCFDLFVFIKDQLSIKDIFNKKKIDEILPLQSISHISFNNYASLIKSDTDTDTKKLYLKFLSSNAADKEIKSINYNIIPQIPFKKEEKKIKNISIVSVNKLKQSKNIIAYSNIIKHAIEENKKKMVKAFKNMILKHKKFDPEISTLLNRSPVNIIYYSKNNKPNLNYYLKSMSIYNMMIKGTFIYFSSCIAYFFKKNNFKKFKNVYKFLFYFFKTMFCLISKPVFVYKTDKIIIQLFYFLIIPNFFKNKILRKNFRYKKQMIDFKRGLIKRKPFKHWISFRIKRRVWLFNKLKFNIRLALRKAHNVSVIDLYPNKFKLICNVLSKAFNKNIELNLIRLHYPYEDSNIFANFLALLVNKIKLRRITRKLFKYAVIKNIKNIVFDNKSNYIPAYLSGMTIKIAGRLMKYKVIPRKTVQKIQKGSSSFGKVNFTDFARYTSKNRRGAFSITVSSGQNFF